MGILQKGAATRGNAFGSHKYVGKSSLRYELGIDILAGNLVWVSGPNPAGKWKDIKICMNELAHCLLLGKWLEVGNGYVGHADKVKCPNNDCSPTKNLAMQACVRSWHETINGRLKNWDITKHGTVFYACPLIIQLAMN